MSHLISVIIPVGSITNTLDQSRAQLSKVKDVEVILVTDESTAERLIPEYPVEVVAHTVRKGRGHACYEGLKKAKGEIILFHHVDTILPQNWRTSLIQVFNDKSIAGGGFSLSFDHKHFYFKWLVFFSNIIFWTFKEVWGDRSVFMRASVLTDNTDQIDIPIMEDVRMSKLIRQKGKIVIIPDRVVTSGKTFLRNGLVWNTLRILMCRIAFGIGFSPEKIYSYYYRVKR